MTKTIFTLKSGDGTRTIKVEVRQNSDHTLELLPEGYGENDAVDGNGSPVFLDLWNDRLRVVVAPDINVNGQPTIIDLEGAREDARYPELSWPLKRLIMADIRRRGRLKRLVTLSTSLESLDSGYEPYVGFDAQTVRAELVSLIDKFGDARDLSDFVTDEDWAKRIRCSMAKADPDE